MKAKNEHHQHQPISIVKTDGSDGWPAAVHNSIRATSRRFANGEINDQAAFDELMRTGVSEQDAKALLRTFMLVSAK